MMKNILILFLLVPLFLYSEDSRNLRIGGAFHYGLNLHSAGFSSIPNVPNCCPEFEEGIGTGISAGILTDIPLFNNVSMQFRLNFINNNGTLVDEEKELMNFMGQDTLGTFEHIIDAGLPTIGFEPHFNYNLFEEFHLTLGARIALPISLTFDQREEISEPKDRGVFVDTETRLRNAISGDIPDATSIFFSMTTSLRYELPLNDDKSLKVAPELQYYLGFNDVFSNSNWKIDKFRIGASLYYELPDPEPMSPIKPQIIDTAEVVMEIHEEIPPIGVDVDAYTSDPKTGDKSKVLNIKVEEFLSTKVKPLLNFVFFDEGSSEIPKRYKFLNDSETINFSINDLFPYSTIETYHHILNIVGKRLTDYPDAELEIIGCNSDEGVEKNNLKLSASRAENVRKYLLDAWDIDSSRISLSERNLPDNPSNINKNDGIIENRRVELYSNKSSILAPVINFDTLRISNPSKINFRIEKEGYITARSSRLDIKQNNSILKRHTISDLTFPYWTWIPSHKEKSRMKNGEITYQIDGIDDLGRDFSSEEKSVEVEKITIQKKKQNRLGDKRIDEFSLILFEFDSDKISEANQFIIDFIKEYIQEDSDIIIKGYTDRIGNDSYNRRLSRKRARTVAVALKNENSEYEGVGEETLIYNNDLPEGRFYSRTVIVNIETPINWKE